MMPGLHVHVLVHPIEVKSSPVDIQFDGEDVGSVNDAANPTELLDVLAVICTAESALVPAVKTNVVEPVPVPGLTLTALGSELVTVTALP